MKEQYTIPKLAQRILQWICKEQYIEEILGDLHEYYFELRVKPNWKKAFMFWFHVMNFIKPWSIKRFEGSQSLNQYGMFKNFIISALRSIKRQKAFSTINILGLAIGISISLMLFLFIRHELSYDKFHENKDRLFKVISHYTTNDGRSGRTGIAFGSVAPEIKSNIPGVENAVRILNMGTVDVIHQKNSFNGQRIYYSDKSFFDAFSFKSTANGLVNKTTFDDYGIVLSQQLASAIFGDKSPLDQEVRIDGKTYRVLDVIDVPKQSHLTFDLIISLETFGDIHEWSYQGGLEFHTYGLYSPNADHQLVNQQVSALYNQQMNDRFNEFVSEVDNYVMPFEDIYLKSEHVSNNLATGSIATIYTLSAINVLILFIAIVNYINLTTAQYEKRIKEIGVRKVIGANRKILVFQFLGESVVLTFISFVIAIILTQFFIQPFGELMQIPASLSYWTDPSQLTILSISMLALGIISGLYPALFISKFSPVRILKRDFLSFKKGTGGSRILVTVQFIIAIALLINLAFLNKQISFVKNKDLGFNDDQVLVIDNLGDVHKKAYDALTSEILTHSSVLEITGAQAALGRGTSGQTVYLEGQSPNTSQPIGEIRTKHNFLKTHDISLLSGRDFSPSLITDNQAFIINESGVALLFPNGDDPVGKVVNIGSRKGPIIGVVGDFHYTSLKRKINPLLISLDEPYRITLSMKIDPSNIKATLEHVESSLQNVDSEYQLSYFFLDDYFNMMFQSEERNAALISYSSIVAGIISLVGLIALISHSLAKRTKEVAIRKVLGAHSKHLMWVLTREFCLVILIANLISIPLSILVIDKWMEPFAYRIELGQNWSLFLAVICAAFVVTFALISAQVARKTKANPAEILANE